MNKVFVLNQFGKPLMPYHPAQARIMLKEKKAFVKRKTPFTIQLTIPVKEKLYPITLGVDASYRHIGLSATTEKEELYASEIETRADVSALLSQDGNAVGEGVIARHAIARHVSTTVYTASTRAGLLPRSKTSLPHISPALRMC